MNFNRRQFLKIATAALLFPLACVKKLPQQVGVWVNDIHSKLNRTQVSRIVPIGSAEQLTTLIKQARRDSTPVAICGGRHAMGAQQFATGSPLLDLRSMRRPLSLDHQQGIVELEAGVNWPELMDYLRSNQQGEAIWTFAQKQTGADNLSIGGALSANAHGRGLRMRPMISNVEAIELVNAKGKRLICNRQQNAELFRLAIGGYGLFGVITRVWLRLVRRQKLQRHVEICTTTGVMQRFDQQISAGALYGDFQFAVDEKSADFMHKGVFSYYKPVALDRPISQEKRRLTPEVWQQLIYLLHTDKSAAFDLYADGYEKTDKQIYWSDESQLNYYEDHYHGRIDTKMKSQVAGGEMISELYVPRQYLGQFLQEAREDLANRPVSLIYGTIRLIEKDSDSFLPWAKEDFACVIFNLHVDQSHLTQRKVEQAFVRLIDIALALNGCYFLTYHRWARQDQLLTAYPEFPEFLAKKLKHDPDEIFQSDWYRYYRDLFRAEKRV